MADDTTFSLDAGLQLFSEIQGQLELLCLIDPNQAVQEFLNNGLVARKTLRSLNSANIRQTLQKYRKQYSPPPGERFFPKNSTVGSLQTLLRFAQWITEESPKFTGHGYDDIDVTLPNDRFECIVRAYRPKKHKDETHFNPEFLEKKHWDNPYLLPDEKLHEALEDFRRNFEETLAQPYSYFSLDMDV